MRLVGIAYLVAGMLIASFFAWVLCCFLATEGPGPRAFRFVIFKEVPAINIVGASGFVLRALGIELDLAKLARLGKAVGIAAFVSVVAAVLLSLVLPS